MHHRCVGIQRNLMSRVRESDSVENGQAFRSAESAKRVNKNGQSQGKQKLNALSTGFILSPHRGILRNSVDNLRHQKRGTMGLPAGGSSITECTLDRILDKHSPGRERTENSRLVRSI